MVKGQTEAYVSSRRVKIGTTFFKVVKKRGSAEVVAIYVIT